MAFASTLVVDPSIGVFPVLSSCTPMIHRLPADFLSAVVAKETHLYCVKSLLNRWKANSKASKTSD